MKKAAAYFLLLLMISCSGSKTLSYEELMQGAPAWVRQTPTDPAYYVGVGMAGKNGSPDDYREVARQNALSELASGISVKISSTSVLSQYEFNNQVSEYYRDSIQLSTQQYLEGYELVDNWENAQQYWVYYRLSKSKFNQIKKDRIDRALESSKADYAKARNFAGNGNASEAMRFYVKSVEDIRNFLGEDLKTEVAGKEEDYSSLLFSDMVSKMQNLRVVYPVDRLVYSRGVGFSNETLLLTVMDENNRPVKGITVDVKFSFSPGRIISRVSDADGQIRLKIPEFDSRKKEEFISAAVNIDNLVKEATDDQMVRRMMQGIKLPEYVLPVQVISPKFFIQSTEFNNGAELKSSTATREFRNLLDRDGFEVVSNRSDADYAIITEAISSKGPEAKGRFTATLTAEFTLESSDGKVIWSKTINDITGLGNSYENAGTDAFNSLGSRVRIDVYPEMYKSVF